MKLFYERYYQADLKLRQAVAVLPWGHNLLLINKVQSLEAVLLRQRSYNQRLEQRLVAQCHQNG
jgi:hypothetical protein